MQNLNFMGAPESERTGFVLPNSHKRSGLKILGLKYPAYLHKGGGSGDVVCEGGDTMNPLLKRASASDRATLMKKRSRSLPHEEFVYLSQKLKELDLIRRTDSIISGQSAR